ncbi:hypothetical protein [Sediminicoccus sp. KRV36]|uniref:hypothetical protein n=1 Tax=Sediminicoccus sp. KRV36 TaxID=3133721 RepID=UPI0020107CAE|nr:hypothetical protein [Sediminicoccus rosea]UPY37796.1 hypothetical protein LHU95_03620 [Sediminicoccus rosea]
MSKDLLAAPEGLEVRIMDLSGANGTEPIEVVRGFTSVAHANAFARRYVRDSVEICRPRGGKPADVTKAWFAFGEDAVVAGVADDAQGAAWTSGTELATFAAGAPRDAEDRNWRILDPRRLVDDEDDDDDMDGEEEA